MKNFYFILVVLIIIDYSLNAPILARPPRPVPYIGNPIAENCVACKFIWENIQEALVDSSSFLEPEGRRNPILAAQAFQFFCRIAPDIFFEPCNEMFEKLFFMTEDFCANKIVEEICVNNEMCPKMI